MPPIDYNKLQRKYLRQFLKNKPILRRNREQALMNYSLNTSNIQTPKQIERQQRILDRQRERGLKKASRNLRYFNRQMQKHGIARRPDYQYNNLMLYSWNRNDINLYIKDLSKHPLPNYYLDNEGNIRLLYNEGSESYNNLQDEYTGVNRPQIFNNYTNQNGIFVPNKNIKAEEILNTYNYFYGGKINYINLFK